MSATHQQVPEAAPVAEETPVSGIDLRFGSYEARVTSLGGALRSLRHEGRDLVVPFDSDNAVPDYRGVVCAPWPNRLADGRYAFEGNAYQLPINEVERSTALHGLVFDRIWTVVRQVDSSVTLSCALDPVEGYPFALSLELSYTLSADGLGCVVRAVNTGSNTAPYGVCPHPYLVAGEAQLDEWVVAIPAAQFLEVTPDRLLPVGLVPVDGHAFDFRTERVVGAIEIDHAFTGIIRDAEGRAAVSVFDPSGTGVELAWGEEWPWLQIHTADKPEGPNRLGLAVEPMTCPPDAFNSGTDLVRLAPGESHRASWTIRALRR